MLPVRWLAPIVLFATLISVPVTAQTSSSAFSSIAIQRLENDLAKARKEMEQRIATRRLLGAQYDSMIVDVIALKQRKDLGFFEKIRLKNLLKESEDVAQQLVSHDKTTMAKRSEYEIRIDEVSILMDGEIREILELLERPPGARDHSAKRQLESQLQAMMIEKLEFQSIWTDPLVLSVQTVRVSRQDDSETISQKADFLKDQEDKLVAYAQELQRKIDQLTNDIEIRDEAMKFLDDVHLFNKNREVKLAHKDEKDKSMVTGKDDVAAPGISSTGDEVLGGVLSFFDAGGPVLVNGNTLTLSDLKMSSEDDIRVIVKKLKIEKRIADQQAFRFQRLADELYELAKYKTKSPK